MIEKELDELMDDIEREEEKERQEFLSKFALENDDGFWEFAKYLDSEFFTEGKVVLKEIALILQKVARGEIKKLIINIMSRTGKSYLVTMWCLYMFGHRPKGSIMRNAYGDKLATKFSRDIRKIIGLPGSNLEVTDKYKKIFPNIGLDSRQQGVYDWALDGAKDVSYSCSGMTGAAKGQGCDIALILDDPSKDEKEDISDKMHEDIWTKYLQTHRDRKANEDVAEIIIMTRSHPKDITGKLEEVEGLVQDGGLWHKICYPALNDEGKSFCEGMKSTSYLQHEKQVYKKADKLHIWETQYQQNPKPVEGYVFPEEKLNYFRRKDLINVIPNAKYITVDFADSGGDFLSAPACKRFGQKMYVTDVLFTKKPTEDSEILLTKMFVDITPHKALFEANSGGKLFAKMIKKNIRSEGVKSYIKIKTTSSNKHIRITSRSGIIIESFYFLEEDEYEAGSDYDKFMKNLTSYRYDGKSKNDDAPDSLTLMVDISGVKISNETTIKTFG